MESKSTPDNLSRTNLEAAYGQLQAEMLQLRKQAQQLQEQLGCEQERSTELAKASAAFKRSLAHLVHADSLQTFLHTVLLESTQASGALTGAVFVHNTTHGTLQLTACVIEGEGIAIATDPRMDIWRAPVPIDLSPGWEVLSRAQQIIWLDVDDQSEDHWAFGIPWHRQMGHQTIADIPLVVGNTVLGFLALCFTDRRPANNVNLEQCWLLAQQTALALQLENLTQQVEAAVIVREREKAAQEQAKELVKANQALQRSLERLTTDASLTTFLGHVLNEITEQVEAASAHIFLYDGGNNTLTLHLSVRDGVLYIGAKPDDPPLFQTPFAADVTPKFRVLCQKRSIASLNSGEFDGMAWPGALAWFERDRVSEAICLALMVGDQPVGMLGLRFFSKTQLEPKDTELIHALAHQATLAIQLTTLAEGAKQAAIAREQEQAAHERAAELVRANQLLKRSLDHLVTTTELEEFTGLILLEITQLVHGVNSVLFLYNPSLEVMQLYMVVNEGRVMRASDLGNQDFDVFQKPIPADQILSWVMLMHNQKPDLVILDDSLDETCWGETLAWHRQKGHQATMSLPLKLANEPWGFFGVAFRSIPDLSDETLELMQTLVHQLTLALQLARIAEENQQTAIVEERNRMAREIHDTLAQSFTSILVRLQTANLSLGDNPLEAQHHLDLASEIARSGLLEARRSVYELRPRPLEEGDLVSAIAEYLHTMTDHTAIQTHFHHAGELDLIPAFIEVELFRIAQEAINNACKHAYATTLTVELTLVANHIQLSIQDNGRGFLLPNSADRQGFGLLSMQERTHRIGGVFTINTCLGKGTQILVNVELRRTELL